MVLSTVSVDLDWVELGLVRNLVWRKLWWWYSYTCGFVRVSVMHFMNG
jgi:hypothetical protein